jgi:hypothetical protein
MARRAVADHTVGRIDRLVECGARESDDGHPQDRRDNRVGKILGHAFNRGAGDACRIERVTVAPDDPCDGYSRRGDAVLVERSGDVSHMPVQASLREQRACN